MHSLSPKKQQKGAGGDPNCLLTLATIAEQCIIEGIENAYQQDQDIKTKINKPPASITEYLITVNVAKNLWDKASLPAMSELMVQVECSAKDFVNNAFERFILNPYKRRENHTTIRNGRIDIAVLRFGKHLDFRSILGIELKGFNPPKNSIRSDLNRLIDAMVQTDAIGANSIEASYCAFIKCLKRKNELLNASEIETRKRALLNALDQNLENIPSKASGLQKIIRVWNIDVVASDVVAQCTPEDLQDYNDIASETKAVVGVLVTLKRQIAANMKP